MTETIIPIIIALVIYDVFKRLCKFVYDLISLSGYIKAISEGIGKITEDIDATKAPGENK